MVHHLHAKHKSNFILTFSMKVFETKTLVSSFSLGSIPF